MEKIIDRFDKYMKINGLNDNKVTIELGLSVGLIGKCRRDGKDLSSRVIKKIIYFYPDLNRDWLLYGEGEMLNRDDKKETTAVINESYVHEIKMKDAMIDLLEKRIEDKERLILHLESQLGLRK